MEDYGLVALVLLWCEAYLIITHTIVLIGLLSIQWVPSWLRFGYFSFDAATVLASFWLLRRNIVLVAIHLTIHILALAELFSHFSAFFRDVYEMAEHRYGSKSGWSITFYVLGTLEDITTHAANWWLLWQLFTKES